MPNLALIIDKSEAFISFQKDQILADWKSDPAATKHIERLNQAGGGTLFGGGITSLLLVEDAEAVKQLVTDLEAEEQAGSIASRVSSGLLITSSVARTSTKKLEALVAKLDGQVVITAVPKGEKGTVAEKLVEGLNLNRDTKSFLLAYVGDDYEAVIPLVKTIGSLAPEQQCKITEEDLFLRMPQPPGSRPPWEVEKPLMRGDIGGTIDVYRRVAEHSHFLVVMKLLNNKFQSSYRVSALLTANPRMNDEALAEASGVTSKTLWLHKNNHKSLGLAKLQTAVELLVKTEAQVKGGSRADGKVLVELLLVRLAILFKR